MCEEKCTLVQRISEYPFKYLTSTLKKLRGGSYITMVLLKATILTNGTTMNLFEDVYKPQYLERA